MDKVYLVTIEWNYGEGMQFVVLHSYKCNESARAFMEKQITYECNNEFASLIENCSIVKNPNYFYCYENGKEDEHFVKFRIEDMVLLD